mmetsp:Transcript_20233/g.46001  ORF Transcript_20233/g.46001 Transcript_20233/m.46001 type:complete len:120 (+) Transcript_20233:139-498(+)
MMLLSEKCDDTCGFLAAIFGAICYGSYGVPIKAASSIDAHPLVVQSYKTLVVFTTSLLILFVEKKPRWTPYGLLADFFQGCFGLLVVFLELWRFETQALPRRLERGLASWLLLTSNGGF